MNHIKKKYDLQIFDLEKCIIIILFKNLCVMYRNAAL